MLDLWEKKKQKKQNGGEWDFHVLGSFSKHCLNLADTVDCGDVWGRVFQPNGSEVHIWEWA